MVIIDGVSSLNIPPAFARFFYITTKVADTLPCSWRGYRSFKPRCPLPPGVSGHPACFSLSENTLLSPADGVLGTAQAAGDPGHPWTQSRTALTLPGEHVLPLPVLGESCGCSGAGSIWDAEAEELWVSGHPGSYGDASCL